MKRLALLVAGALALTGLLVPAASPAAAAPPPPTITFPDDGTSLCSVTFHGRAEPGTTVTVYDAAAGALGSTVTTDGGYWTLDPTLPDGRHEVWAVAADATGESAPSAHVTFYNDPWPPIGDVAVSPRVISPRHHDGVRDTLTMSVPNHAAGTVVFVVTKPLPDGEIGRGEWLRSSPWIQHAERDTTYTWTWDGRDDDGRLLPSGDYITWVDWYAPEEDGACSHYYLYDTPVTVDDSGPSFTGVTSSVGTFYPRRDDAFGAFRNTVTATVTGLGEPAWVRAQLFRHGSAVAMRNVALGHHDAGSSASWAWNGRRTDGTLLPEGSYDIRFRLLDDVGNVSYTPRAAVALSHKHVVAHTLTRTKAAADYYAASHTGTPCAATVSEPLSDYDGGLLVRYCGDTAEDDLSVHWLFAAPRAAVYDTITPFAYGKARTTDARLPFWLRNARDGGITRVGFAEPAEGRHVLTATPGGPHVSSRHTIRLIGRAAGFTTGTTGYDVRTVGVTLRYGTLER